MNSKFIDPWSEKRFYSRLRGMPLYYRMFFDESFSDVRSDDVKGLIRFLYKYDVPYEIVMRIREKYKVQLADETGGIQGVINRYGLRAPEHIISYTNPHVSAAKLYINGYTEMEWKYLTVEDLSFIDVPSIKRFINRSVRSGDTAAAEILTTKYGAELEEYERNRAARILLEHNILPDTKYSQLDELHIDGITFNCWRLLHDDEYQPSRPILVSNHFFLKRYCRYDDITFIEDKYHEALFPHRKEIFSEREKAEANYFFAHIHD